MAKIQQLRSLVELNFCERCFQYYKMLIEPSIKALLAKPLNDWVWVETQITEMVMKSEGVFKTNEIIISFDKGEEEKVANQIDVKRFKEINSPKWGFKRKIDYLYNKGILQNSSYKLLDKAREARNKIHKEPIMTELTEQDYVLFSVANNIVSQLWQVVLFEGNEEFNSTLKSDAEKVAEWALSKIG